MYYPEGMKARVSPVQSTEPHRILAPTRDLNREPMGPQSRVVTTILPLHNRTQLGAAESRNELEFQAAESAKKFQLEEFAADLAARESQAKIRSLEIESERNNELLIRIQNENKLLAENEKSIREKYTQIRLAEISASNTSVSASKSQSSFNDNYELQTD